MVEQSSSAEAEAQGVGAENRQSHRASLMLRRAKLVCQSGEYLTLIRDVSEKGIGLGFLHDVPPEPRTLLQLAKWHDLSGGARLGAISPGGLSLWLHHHFGRIPARRRLAPGSPFAVELRGPGACSRRTRRHGSGAC